MKNFLHIASGIDVTPLVLAIQQQPELWDQNTVRKTAPETPHAAMSDMWIRYNDDTPYRLTGDYSTFNDPHFPIWYPAYYALPQLRQIIFGLMARMSASHLGGVMITKIPPGGRILPHTDKGWHAEFYKTKIYVPLQTNPDCWNRCENEIVTMKQGEAWYFNNLVEHEVQNAGDEDRMTLIICMRTE